MDEIIVRYMKQQEKKELAKQRMEYFVNSFFTTDEIVQCIIDDIKKNDFDEELFEYYQEELQKYINENIRNIGKPEFKRYLDMVAADSTWMYVLMRPEMINMYPEYKKVNEKYKIHNQ